MNLTYVLLKPVRDGMRFLDLGCGSGAAAYYLASPVQRRNRVRDEFRLMQADICRRKFEKFNGRVRVVVCRLRSPRTDGRVVSTRSTRSSRSATPRTWTPGWRAAGGSLKPGGRLLDTFTGIALDALSVESMTIRSVTAFFENWRYNFLGANLLVFKLRRLGFHPIRYRQCAVLGMGPNVQLHSTRYCCGSFDCACAPWSRLERDHLAHVEGFRLRQRVQHRACQQAIDAAPEPVVLAQIVGKMHYNAGACFLPI